MNRIFFYGLFMDETLLTEQGLNPRVEAKASLDGYRIQIGERATLVPAEGGRAWGVVMSLSDSEAVALYAEPSVQAYRPESVEVDLVEGGGRVTADCYNLAPELGTVGSNPVYAKRLAALLDRMGFERTYVEEVAAFAEDSASDAQEE